MKRLLGTIKNEELTDTATEHESQNFTEHEPQKYKPDFQLLSLGQAVPLKKKKTTSK